MLRLCMTDTAPDKRLLRSANEQIKAVRRERDELAQQIRLSQENDREITGADRPPRQALARP